MYNKITVKSFKDNRKVETETNDVYSNYIYGIPLPVGKVIYFVSYIMYLHIFVYIVKMGAFKNRPYACILSHFYP